MAALDLHTVVSCPSCGSAQVDVIGPLAPGSTFAGRPLEEPMPGETLYRCAICYLVFRHPLPSKETLDMLHTAQYSHAKNRTVWVRVSEGGINVLYSSPLFKALRTSGFGGIDTVQHPELASVPPVWMTAKDHVLAIFQKP